MLCYFTLIHISNGWNFLCLFLFIPVESRDMHVAYLSVRRYIALTNSTTIILDLFYLNINEPEGARNSLEYV